MDSNKQKILEQLQPDAYITAMTIAERVGMSEKTVRSRIKELNLELRQAGAQIVSKKAFGFSLSITDKEVYEAWKRNPKAGEESLPSIPAERAQYLLGYLLNQNAYVKMDDLSEFFYISRNTLTADIKQVECILNLYHLKLERRPGYGICVIGNEFDRRICMENCLLKSGPGRFISSNSQEMIQKLAGIIQEVQKNCGLKISELAMESLLYYLYISGGRIERGHVIEAEREDMKKLQSTLMNYALETAGQLLDRLKEASGISYPESELCYLALYISSKASATSGTGMGINPVIPGYIDELTTKMLEAVYETNGADFRDNLDLRMSLNVHMASFDIRMKYDLTMQNPILDNIRKNYAYAYTLAMTACTLLGQHYGKEIPEDEVGYFALLFALAVEKQEKPIRKKNIVVVCVSGRGSSQLFMYRYKQAFGKYINQIYESTVRELKDFDFRGKEIDYVFTTAPLRDSIPVPVVEISLFFDSGEIERYRYLFEQGEEKFLQQYFDERLFLRGLKGDSKEEILRKICERIHENYDLPDGFLESVLTREKMGQTDFGNLVALPHPYRVMTEERFVAAAVLEKPGWWGNHEVQVVFLMSMSGRDKDVERVYQTTAEFVFHGDAVKKFLADPQYTTLMRILSGYAAKF